MLRKVKKMGIMVKKHSDEARRKIVEAQLGTKCSEEAKRKIRETIISKPDLTCPHCNKTGGNAGMKRWHFDNCKELSLIAEL